MYDIRSAMLNIGIVFTPGKFKINLEKTWKTPGILVNLRSTDPVPNIDWINARFTNLVATHLCPIIEDLFLEQLVQEPTRGNNILDLIFSEKELIDSINVTKTCLSDHSMLLCHTLIPICSLSNVDRKNPPLSVFKSLNFRNGNWDLLRSSISDIDWITID